MVENDKLGIIDTVTSQFALWRGFFTRASGLFQKLTFRLPEGSSAETIEQLSQRYGLSEQQRQFLTGLSGDKAGAAFIADKIEEMNRASLHRSAFVLNAFTHLLFVDIGAQLFCRFRSSNGFSLSRIWASPGSRTPPFGRSCSSCSPARTRCRQSGAWADWRPTRTTIAP